MRGQTAVQGTEAARTTQTREPSRPPVALRCLCGFSSGWGPWSFPQQLCTGQPWCVGLREHKMTSCILLYCEKRDSREGTLSWRLTFLCIYLLPINPRSRPLFPAPLPGTYLLPILLLNSFFHSSSALSTLLPSDFFLPSLKTSWSTSFTHLFPSTSHISYAVTS